MNWSCFPGLPSSKQSGKARSFSTARTKPYIRNGKTFVWQPNKATTDGKLFVKLIDVDSLLESWTWCVKPDWQWTEHQPKSSKRWAMLEEGLHKVQQQSHEWQHRFIAVCNDGPIHRKNDCKHGLVIFATLTSCCTKHVFDLCTVINVFGQSSSMCSCACLCLHVVWCYSKQFLVNWSCVMFQICCEDTLFLQHDAASKQQPQSVMINYMLSIWQFTKKKTSISWSFGAPNHYKYF